MQFIHAKERYSASPKSLSIGLDVLREAVKRFDRSPDEAFLERLPGGFANANYLATVGQERFVLRVYPTDASVADRECDLLNFLAARGSGAGLMGSPRANRPGSEVGVGERSSPDILVPRVLARFDVREHPVAVLDFVDGMTLEDRLLAGGEAAAANLYFELGAQLARIHRITFAESGFLGPKLVIGREYDDCSTFLRQFIEQTLSMLLTRPDRLGLELNHRLGHLVNDAWALVSVTEPRRQLVHSDFNPKNLLVSRGPSTDLLAVIDWEFCMSGNGLGDLGNFFRFEYDYAEGAREIFADGYRSVSPDLPANWFDVAKLLDLANLCWFLDRSDDYQKTFHTARTVIQATLEHFGY